jgi:hypothetical protein
MKTMPSPLTKTRLGKQKQVCIASVAHEPQNQRSHSSHLTTRSRAVETFEIKRLQSPEQSLVFNCRISRRRKIFGGVDMRKKSKQLFFKATRINLI